LPRRIAAKSTPMTRHRSRRSGSEVQAAAQCPAWWQVLRALREARGVTQEGWAAWLELGLRTIQRWERGETVPDAAAEAAIIAHCAERGLFRTFGRGPLQGVALTPQLLQDLLAEARLGGAGTAAEHVPAPPGGAGPPLSESAVAPLPTRLGSLPTGTVTLLFTDIEGSTRLLQRLGDRYPDVLATHRDLLRAACTTHDGDEVDTQGDACFYAFVRATQAVTAAVEAQRALAAYPWPAGGDVRVRMGLHTGEPQRTADGYAGMDVHRAARIAAAGHGGQVLLSRATADLVRPDLPDGVDLKELGPYRLKDLAHPEPLAQLVIAGLPREFPPLQTLPVQLHNLPAPMTSFVGRVAELIEVRRLLGMTRLLTLTGAGGSGKTRLALEAARELAETCADGVWLVDLAPLTDPSLVPQAVAVVLGVREVAGQPLTERLAEVLRSRALLLVLDNCEHLVAACAHLADTLLHACPKLQVLATSREVLGIAGETVYRVPPLSVPEAGALCSVEELTHFDAVRLFAGRAAAAHPAFRVTEANAAAVTEVCRRLDGLPLALELAAARVPTLSVDEIAARLADRFRLLTGGGRTASPRQQTLRAMLDWSHDLLTEHERIVFRRLGVFAGGWTLAAAAAACLPADDRATAVAEPSDELAMLDLLTRLVEKSLVVVEEQHPTRRYRLLETIRAYALERLAASGEAEDLQRRHAALFATLAEAPTPMLPEPDSNLAPTEPVPVTVADADRLAWLNRLDADLENLRVALEWSLAEDSEDRVMWGLRLAVALARFWSTRYYWREGRGWLERVLARRWTKSQAGLRAQALRWAGRLAFYQDQPGAARPLFEESLALFRTTSDTLNVALGLTDLGMAVRDLGESAAARRYAEESLSSFRRLEHDQGIAMSLVLLGSAAAHLGDLAEAQTRLGEALFIYKRLGDSGRAARCLNGLGDRERIVGDYRKALALYEQALTLCRDASLKARLVASLLNLGQATRHLGDYQRAAGYYAEGLLLAYELGKKSHASGCLTWLAGIAALQGQPLRAARLVGAAQALREPGELTAGPADRAQLDEDLAVVRSALDEQTFAAAAAEGRAMSFEQAVAYALEGLARIIHGGSSPGSPRPIPGSP
jgi:predicted ATPase/class 3 adenylate cyclase